MKLLYVLCCACFLMFNVTPAAGQEKAGSDSLKIYSVAGKNKLFIRLIAANEEKAGLQVVDVSGKICLVKQVVLKKGVNTININIHSLKTGIYFLKVIQLSKVSTVKFQVGMISPGQIDSLSNFIL